MPKPLQIARSEGMVGSVLRFHIFEIVVWASPERLAKLFDSAFRIHPRILPPNILSLYCNEHLVSTKEII